MKKNARIEYMKFYFSITILSIFLLNGCGFVEPKPHIKEAKTVPQEVISSKSKNYKIAKPEKIENIPTLISPISYQPDWIMNSNKEGYLCNIGSARD